ncbi:tRNA (adenosine(37)-N6)-threonylcarbamoyltransferase complex dimerization subunit type 1 TsaB [Pseudoroseicyclus sp. CXY001]|uniref:tRNA (adenosine(37)-N6)-threonylcarbamoyltransferase complex dimerization subunit type 1 TsaB n=1 Tax=Pseudoroseicyclus sp. CXY001 TaxID=3242492 RepID=UPI003570FE25
MTVLAFDTSGPQLSAALLAGGALTTRVEPMARGQAERLMGLLEELLAEAGLVWGDLTAIGVGIGPGNFTGIRLSVSAARGLAIGLGIPAIGVDLFAAAGEGDVALPAPRGMAYLRPAGGAAMLVPEAEVPPGAAGPASPEAAIAAIARIAAARLAEGAAAPRPVPLYIRAPDAAPPKLAPPPMLP